MESRYSTWAAKHYVYSTWWFAAFFCSLGTNVLCSALSRYPWKKHQTGFVITHSGILLILLGSLVTQQWETTARSALPRESPGRSSRRTNPPFTPRTGRIRPRFFRPVSLRGARARTIRKPGNWDNGGLALVNQYYFNAQKKVQAQAPEAGQKGVPAVHVVLASSFVNQDQWFFLGDKDYGQIDLGPASVYYVTLADWRAKLRSSARFFPPNVLAILAKPGGTLEYQTRHRGQWVPIQPLTVGVDNATGWMDMQFRVVEKRDSGVPGGTIRSSALPEQRDPEPALHYEVLFGTERHEGWIGYENQQSFTLGGKPFAVAFGPRQHPLTFRGATGQVQLGRWTRERTSPPPTPAT